MDRCDEDGVRTRQARLEPFHIDETRLVGVMAMKMDCNSSEERRSPARLQATFSPKFCEQNKVPRDVPSRLGVVLVEKWAFGALMSAGRESLSTLLA